MIDLRVPARPRPGALAVAASSAPVPTPGKARLERALSVAARFAPEATAAARGSLGRILAWTGTAEGRSNTGSDDRWTSSHLARDGSPVEMGFVFAAGSCGGAGPSDGELRFTAEVAGPEVPPVDRLDRALALAAELGFRPVSPAVLDLLDGLRRDQATEADALLYGAWLSTRHGMGPDGVESRLKLYVEVPPDAGLERPGDWVERLLGPAALTGRRVHLRMVGIELRSAERDDDSDSGTDRSVGLELYHDLSWLQRSDLPRLAGRLGLERRTPDLLELLDDAVGSPLRRLPVPCDWGFSQAVRLDASGTVRPTAFTLYTFANALFGGDGKIRRRLLALGERRDWNLQSLGLYEALSAPLADRRGFLTHHGVFGATVTADSEHSALATFGLTPPPLRSPLGEVEP